MGTQAVAVVVPPASQWIEAIEARMPKDPCHRKIVARALLLCLRVAKFLEPMEQLIAPMRIFECLEETYGIGPVVRFEVAQLAGCFNDLDAAAAETVREYLRKLVDAETPKDSLRAHLAAALNATCVDTDYIGQVSDIRPLLESVVALTLTTVDSVEEFTVKNVKSVSNEEILRAIYAFYESRGYKMKMAVSNFVTAKKGDEELRVGFTNYSHWTEDPRILVTVKAR